MEFLITFVNGIINKKEYTLKPLDYKSNIDKMKKDEDIKLLDKTVKDYLYQDISRKYFKTPINWNKQIINHLLKDQKDNEVINFVLNMKIKDWIELFTLKKNIYAFENLSINGYEEIQNKMQKVPSIKDIFNKILEKYKDDLYFTKFVFYLYNYEKWFRSKIGRNREKREKQILILI